MERISLSNAVFEGNSNAYLVTAGGETALVDTGDWMETTRNQLKAGLAAHDVTFADIDTVFLTHWHPDHTGLAGEIQQAGGATVYVHTADAPLVAGDADALAALDAAHERAFEAWDIPEPDRTELREALTGHERTGESPTVTTVEDGETFTVGDRKLRAVHAPGHAAGLCLFEIDDGEEVLTGDALLPEYTPNVGGADVRVDRPLERYLHTLRAIARAEYNRAWPGHREPIDDPTARAREIIRHHETRAYRVLDALDRLGPCSPWRVSADLFGNLSDIHILHGPGECVAHLEHLEREDIVVSTSDGYRLADGIREELRRHEGNRWPLS